MNRAQETKNYQWLNQFKYLCRSLWWVYGSVFALFVLEIFLRIFYEIPFAYLMRDPADIIRHSPISGFPFYKEGIVDLPFYLGAVSYMGILLWCATSAICFFTFAFLRKVDHDGSDRSFFLTGAIISLLILIDDLFRMHEIVFPVYLHLHEYVPYAIYGGLILFFLLKYRAMILQTEYLLLLFALFCLGFSLFVDVLTDTLYSNISGATLAEDGSKVVGILSWFLYFARVCFYRLKGLAIQKMPP